MGVSQGGNQQGGGEAKAEKKEEKKEEVKKTHYDIELVAFDAAKKITLIKEVRTLFGLGLKEAKDLVEKVPGFIKRDCIAADADDIKAKLEA